MSTNPCAPAARQVDCPACKGPSLYAPSNPWRPFCSRRCREADLGAWASEGYRVPEPAQPEPDEAPPAPRH
ncbi:MAG: DNA gyrase inhibitor YacG [Rubrivivax sp.]